VNIGAFASAETPPDGAVQSVAFGWPPALLQTVEALLPLGVAYTLKLVAMYKGLGLAVIQVFVALLP